MFSTAVQAVFGADTGPLVKGIGEADGAVGKFSTGVKSMMGSLGATLGAGAVIGWFSSIVESAGRLQDVSDNLNVSTDALQGFNYAITQAGGSTEDASKILHKTGLSLDELASGNAAAEKNFAALHLTAKDFKGLTLEQSMEKIAKASKDYGHEAGAASAANDILGKTGSKLNSVIEQLGTDGFQKLTADAREAGQVIGGETIAKLDQLGDNMAKLKGAATTVGATILGAVASFTEGLGKFAAKTLNMFDNIPTAQEEIAVKAERVAVAHDKVSAAIRGTKATVEDLAKAKDTEAKKSEEAALAQMSSHEKIEAWQKKIFALTVERSRFDKDTKEALAVQATIGETINKITAERNKIVDDTKKKEEQLAKAKALDRDAQIELLKLESKGYSELSEADRARLVQLRLIAKEKGVAVDIDELMQKGTKNLTAEEKKKLLELIKQDDALKAAIAKQAKLVELAIEKAKAEGKSTVELEKQRDLLTAVIKKEEDLVKVKTKHGRGDEDLTDRELAEKETNLRAVITANQAGDPTGHYAFLTAQQSADLVRVKAEQGRRAMFRQDYSRIGDAAFLKYSAFDEQTLRGYIRPEDEKRAQQTLETLQEINRRLRAAGLSTS